MTTAKENEKNLKNSGEKVSGEAGAKGAGVKESTAQSAAPAPTQATSTTPAPKKKRRGLKIFGGCCIFLLLFLSFGLNILLGFGLLLGSGGNTGNSILYNEVTLEEADSFDAAKLVQINLAGPIFQDSEAAAGILGQTSNTDEVLAKLNLAIEDDSIEGVLLKIDSPGGSVTASEALNRKILEVQDAGKAVVSYIHSSGTSGAYYTAVASDSIVANPTSVNGSIGVIIQSYQYEELLNKIGVNVQTFKSGEFKDLLDGSRDITEEERSIVQGLVDSSFNIFLDRIDEGRQNLDRATIEELADGRIYTAEEAANNGLIDSVGYIEDALNVLADEAGYQEYTLIEYQRNFSFLEGFGQGFPLGIEGEILEDLKRAATGELHVLYL